MNCEPKDLAVIVNCSPGEEWALGHVCTIIEREDHPLTGELGWYFEPALTNGRIRRNCTLDRHLRPIRDPGPDAVDETLVGKPAAVLEEVTS